MIKSGIVKKLDKGFIISSKVSSSNIFFKIAFPAMIISFSVYFCFWWLYKLDVLPGLHGDEAWAGLKAHEFDKSGIEHLYGMNNYTGILQSLIASFAFKLFNIGVFQLRISGAFFNFMGLLIIGLTFYKNKLKISLLIFLLIVSQSGLYLISPRVAWEVNTFTLFFFSLLVFSGFKIINGLHKPPVASVLLFWVTNLLGTYNHIIFSCISVALLAGLIVWTLYTQSLQLKNAVYILLVNFFNIILVYLCMKYWLDATFFVHSYFLPFLLLLLIAELYITKALIKMPLNKFIKIRPLFIHVVLAAVFILFGFYHGLALLQVMTNYKLLIHAYSYQPPLVFELLLLAAGCLFVLYLCYFIFTDIMHGGPESIYAFFILAYMALFPFYTTNCSFRYYLSIDIILGLYAAVKIANNVKLCRPLLTSLAMTVLLLNSMMIYIFTSAHRPFNAIDFKIGYAQVETSAHFLPNRPLIDFLRKNQIGKVTYISDQYFLEQPVLFYQLINPWPNLPGNKAIVDFDYSGNKQGFMLYKEK